MSKLRWGILGVAKINRRLIPAFRASQHNELRALGGRDPERVKAAAARDGIPVAHGSYDAVLADPAIDAVYIPLPNHLHAEWARKAADAGKHVLCEKPLTPTAAEAEALVAHCRARGVTLMDGFMWPHHPRTARLRGLIDGGTLGPLRRVTSAFTFALEPGPNIRRDPDKGGGSLLDVGCYCVYASRWAMNAEPTRVCAFGRFEDGVDMELSGVLQFADGRMASFDCGFNAPMRQWVEVVGEAGVLRVTDLFDPAERAAYTLEPKGGQAETVTLEAADHIKEMVDDFARAVRAKELSPGMGEAVKTLRVMDAVTRSAREGRAVDV